MRRSFLFPLLLAIGAAAPLWGTTVSVGTIEQPVNLGAHADGSRIPLGPVPFLINHAYQARRVISAPRPSTHGGLEWKGGLELNMNLASAFGIVVVPQDESMLGPVTIRVKDWPVPAYSPYTKKQVVAATLHCILRTVYATPKKPLEIRMLGEDPREADSLAAFTGKYINAPEKGEEPSKIPGSSLVTDDRGVTWVTFSEAKAPSSEALRRTPPVMVPFHFFGGDSDHDIDFQFLPIWVGDTWIPQGYSADERNVISHPISLFYDLFHPAEGVGRNWNVRHNKLAPARSTWRRAEQSDLFRLIADNFDSSTRIEGSVAATCYAAILTALPTETRPLEIQLHMQKDQHESLQAFKNDPAWKIASGSSAALTCQFVWDSSKGTLTKGSVPGWTIGGGKGHGWTLKRNALKPAEDRQTTRRVVSP